jgi:hypothetical protein
MTLPTIIYILNSIAVLAFMQTIYLEGVYLDLVSTGKNGDSK